MKIIHVKTVDSTQNLARSLVDAGEWTVVVADTQTGGRGRMGRLWASPKGGLWATVIVYPHTPAREATILSLIPALAVADTLQEYGVTPKIRWPNDIYVDEKKIAGILVEADVKTTYIERALIGIGVNVNFTKDQLPSEIKERATTLFELTGKETNLNILLNSVIEKIKNFMNEYKQQGAGIVIEKIKRKLDIINQNVIIEMRDGYNVAARVVDITETGNLYVIINNDKNHARYISQHEVNRIMKG